MEDMKLTLQETLDHINAKLKTDYQMTVTKAKAGHARFGSGRFTVPEHALHRGTAYGVAYVCHEVAHLVTSRGHDNLFFAEEDRLCIMFGLSLERKKVYLACIYRNGLVAYGQSAHPNETESARMRRMCRNAQSRRCKERSRA